MLFDGFSDAIAGYRVACGFPTVVSGHLNSSLSGSQSSSATLLLRQRNVAAGEFEFTQVVVNLTPNGTTLDVSLNSPPACVRNSMSFVSPSGNKQITVRNGINGQDLMCYWQDHLLQHTTDMQALGLHGKIIQRAPLFYACTWSSDSRYFFYLAHKSRPRSCSYFDDGLPSKLENGFQPGAEYGFTENWGEGLTDVSKTVIGVFDSEEKFTFLVPFDGGNDLCIKTVFPHSYKSDVIYCIAYYEKPFPLGVAWITQRKSCLLRLTNWKSPESVKVEKLVDDSLAVLGASISPDGSKLAWLQCPAGGPHNRRFELWTMNLSDETVKKITSSTEQSLYVHSVALAFNSNNCWLPDNSTLLLSAIGKSRMFVIAVNVNNGKFVEIGEKTDSSHLLLDISRENVLLLKSSPTCPVSLVLGKLSTDSLQLTSCQGSLFPSNNKILSDNICYSIEKTFFNDFECQYIKLDAKKAKSDKQSPLVVFIHGGPHSAFSTFFPGYVEEAIAYVMSGFSVILINYCGSIGFDSLEALPGNLNKLEVESCHHCVQDVLTKNSDIDPKRIYLAADSFGGFIILHLVSRFPNFYKAAVCRNPVTDLSLMAHIADCPDWVFVESGLRPCLQGFPDYSTLIDVNVALKLNDLSPIKGVSEVKSPLLFALGRNDARVPMPSSLSYIRILKQANPNLPVDACIYDDGHVISGVKNHADLFMKSISWFKKYC